MFNLHLGHGGFPLSRYVIVSTFKGHCKYEVWYDGRYPVLQEVIQMPWLISALALLGGSGLRTGAGALARRIAGPAVAIGAGVAGGEALGGLFGGDGDGGRPRRRRRRALTQSDKNDIAFMAATLGDAAARKFALIIAARAA